MIIDYYPKTVGLLSDTSITTSPIASDLQYLHVVHMVLRIYITFSSSSHLLLSPLGHSILIEGHVFTYMQYSIVLQMLCGTSIH